MMRRWWLWKVEVKRVELVFVLFVLFMFRCLCCKEEEKWCRSTFCFYIFSSLIVFSMQ